MKSERAPHQPQSELPAAMLSPRNPEDLRWEMQQLQVAIARRAYELFETRGCEHGHDREDWFRAESELLSPVSVSMQESPNRISRLANVQGGKEVGAAATGKGLPLWEEIPNQNLKASDIPSATASWDQIKRFAGSFNAYRSLKADRCRELDSQTRGDLLEGGKLALDGLGLSELRAILFLHWRSLRHTYWGGEPSPWEMAYTRKLIEAIRIRKEKQAATRPDFSGHRGDLG
jgi:hypothetical protein